jgi:hypothetical protein
LRFLVGHFSLFLLQNWRFLSPAVPICVDHPPGANGHRAECKITRAGSKKRPKESLEKLHFGQGQTAEPAVVGLATE